MSKLTVKTHENLELSDPFMIASSHWTSNETVFRRLAQVNPSALTLKTTSQKSGGSGEAFGNRRKFELVDTFGNPFAIYTDGPKTLELWDIATTYVMSSAAKKILPETKLGLSVLQGEDYYQITRSLNMDIYSYVELNWKYTFRKMPNDFQAGLPADVEKDLEAFIKAFEELPKIVKLSREALQLINTSSFSSILTLLQMHNVSLLVANSLRICIPPSCLQKSRNVTAEDLASGVVVGEHLFLETFHALRSLHLRSVSGESTPITIATGGIMTISGCIDMFAAGAQAVQLCSLLDHKGVEVVDLLRKQLDSLCRPHSSFEGLLSHLRTAEANWFQASEEARVLELDESKAIRSLFESRTALIPYIEATLQRESAPFVDEEISLNSGPLPSDDSSLKGRSFITSRGNITAHLLARRIIKKMDLNSIDIDDMSKFIDELKRPNFSYDFAIIPISTFEYLIKQDAELLGDRLPVEIGQVSNSIIELVGSSESRLDQVSRVLHFGGRSARFAMPILMEEIKPEFQQVKMPELLPMLKFWKKDNFILAKPPLSSMYGLLADDDSKKAWHSFWSTNERMILVGSRQTMKSYDGPMLARTVFSLLQEEKKEIHRNPKFAADDVLGGEFIPYAAKLLGATVF